MRFARLDSILSGIFLFAKKYFQILLPRLCQNRVFRASSNRGGKLPYCRARSPPPFLEANQAGKGARGYQNTLARFKARLSAFTGGAKNNLKFLTADFAKTAFLEQVVYEGITPLPFHPERR